jgi:hypothetical protein
MGMVSHPLTKGAVGIAALLTVSAKATMAQKGQLSPADSLSTENSGEHQIQNRYPMMQTTGGDTQKRHLT